MDIAKILLDRGAKPNSESRVSFCVMYSYVSSCIFQMNRCIAVSPDEIAGARKKRRILFTIQTSNIQNHSVQDMM